MKHILTTIRLEKSFWYELVILMASVKHKDTIRKKKTKRVCKLARELTNQLLVKAKQLSDYDP